MKKYKIYIIFIIIGCISLSFMLFAKVKIIENRKDTRVSQEAISKAISKKQVNKTYVYSQIIHLANKYNGQIKEFKINEKNSKFINAVIKIQNSKSSIEDFFNEIRNNENINKINSISINNEVTIGEQCELNIDIEFKV